MTFRLIGRAGVLGVGLAVALFSAAVAGEYALTVDPVIIDTGKFSRDGIGFNGASPGPVPRFKQGEDVTIKVTNNLSEPTSIHWHGLILPYKQDGVLQGFTPLINGKSAAANWTGLFKPGERIRLRFINSSAMTYFDIRIPGLKMTVVQADGNNVQPVPIDEFRIAVAETYDVIVRPTEDRAYTIFAETMGRTAFARGTLAPREGIPCICTACGRSSIPARASGTRSSTWSAWHRAPRSIWRRRSTRRADGPSIAISPITPIAACSARSWSREARGPAPLPANS